MKKNILILIIVSLTFSSFAEDGIVLLNKLSYYSSDSFKLEGRHFFGDKVQLTGQTKEVPGSSGSFLCKEYTKDNKNYLVSSYFTIGNSTEGAIKEQAFIYEMNDLSTPTSKMINPLTFVAVDLDTINYNLVKISYLSKSNKRWIVSNGWIKKEFISFLKDDWGAAIKFHLAAREDNLEDREERLKMILKRHKSSVFIPLVKSMINEGHLRVTKSDNRLDDNFAGTDSYLSRVYNVTIYKDFDILSEILFKGETKIRLKKRSLNQTTFGGRTDYMYQVTTGEVTGWIHGLDR